MVGYKTIDEMTYGEREEILFAVADTLEVSAREALLEGEKAFALNSQTMAATIRVNADELAGENVDAASSVLEQAMNMIVEFRKERPYPAQSFLIH
ncbi:MAG: hypothetical protein KGI75_26525 [Rhizobiaceae bacterium]|nr:hypothetical protein [Rhizobiaceae bacterium]